MTRYFGGPLDGKDIITAFDHLPVIDFPWPESHTESPTTIERYEIRRGGTRHHVSSRPYPIIGGPHDP